MTINPGAHLGPYEIQSALGAGGMGEVYRARDARLNRVVAIKVLPQDVSDDPRRRERFDHEARIVSSLNHPHICTLFDVGHQDGVDYLVMELLEGQTLSERLTRGALPLEQALQYGIQLASALDAAHRKGIVHRDLKPANVMLTKAGAKLLDFGIAKALAAGPQEVAPRTQTEEGMLLGTLQYMAPEQLEGRNADGRSDLFAFGAMLYEMVTGRRAFSGESQASVIASVLDSLPPPIREIDASMPPALDHLISTCLAKNPDERWQSAGDLNRQLEWIVTSARPAAALSRSARGAWTVAAIATAAALIGGAALAWQVRTAQRQAGPSRVSRTTIGSSGAATLRIATGRSLTITPDGKNLVYVGNNGTQLFARPLDQLEATAIYTTVAPLNWVFASPDSQSIGFDEGGTLKKVALIGGPAATILSTGLGNASGATWAPDDTIVFATADSATGLQRVPASGGDVTVLTRPSQARGELDHLWPEMLPGGRAVLFTITAVTGGLDAAQVAVLDLASGISRVLLPGGSHARYVPSGHLVYTVGGGLRAVPFDVARLETRGTPVTVLQRLEAKPEGAGDFDVAADGTLAYVDPPDSGAALNTLVWVDHQGREEPLGVPARPYYQPRVSRDGTRVALAIGGQSSTHIWVLDLARRSLDQLTFGPQAFAPVWARDGGRLFFFSPTREAGLFWQSADGAGEAERLGTGLPSGVTPDGKRVLFTSAGAARDVMVLTLDGTRRLEPLIRTPLNERNGVVSPDGRWLAYEADSSDKTFEVYVKPFPNVSAGFWKVSTRGGVRPLWSPGGEELFYEAPSGAIMGVRIIDGRGRTWNASGPEKLVEGPYVPLPGSVRNFDVSTDGKRFLMVKAAPAVAPPIIIVQNWGEELKRLAPATR